MGTPLRALIVEDSSNDLELLVCELEKRGYDVAYEHVQTADEMTAALKRGAFDVVISDYSLPQFNGMAALEVLHSSGLDLPFIIVSGTIGEETAVSALKAGAHDFLVKGKLARLVPVIERERREVLARSAQAEAQKALHNSEARFRSLVEHAVFGIYQSTLEGQLLSVNPALVAMLGFQSPDELLSAGLRSVCADANARADLQRVHALQRFTGEEMSWKQTTGELLRVRLSGRQIAAASEIPTLEVIVEDITEQHRLEVQLRQAQKMEGIGRLAGGIAHDFNNMLTTIVGYSDMILEQIGTDKPISPDILEIRRAADRAASLTRQLLAFSRQQVLRIGAVDLNVIVRDMRPMLQRLIGEDVSIEMALAEEVQPIKADRVQLEQVLMNIAVNARDAMPRGGRFTIGTSSATARELTSLMGLPAFPGRYVALSMSDNGEGMDARTRERIFEPFFTTKEMGKGTGLGLATVYGIVKQLEGYIWVTSEPGVGTTFTLYFPEREGLVHTTQVSAPASTEVAVALARYPVMVVEDEAGLRKLIVRTLSRHGYKVVEASSGPEGLAAAKGLFEDGLRLVISDVVMPAMSGPEMIRQLRTQRPNLKVLYTSGYAGDTLSRGGDLETNAPFLEKPFTPQDLLRKVQELLNV